jgi:hypothetical protein
MSPDSRADRRWGARMPVDLPVRLALPRGRIEGGRMRNLSLSGALIECAAELPTFTRMRVEILIENPQGARNLQLDARVVRSEHPRLGIEWSEFEPPALRSLLGREFV